MALYNLCFLKIIIIITLATVLRTESKKSRVKTIPMRLLEMRKSGGLGQDDSCGGGEKRLNSG